LVLLHQLLGFLMMTFIVCKLLINQLSYLYYLTSFRQYLSIYCWQYQTLILLRNFHFLFHVMMWNWHWLCSSTLRFTTHSTDCNFKKMSYHLVCWHQLLSFRNYACPVDYSYRHQVCCCNNFIYFYWIRT